ncbi:hypothetical protein [Actinoplanes teichomyceticus]|uniref:Uncharacterized protein n=1 Tax=Actinoplanes teichomyceticus TaxID=1867 RepID=A0A561WKW0_ACTTI|nr:hypothetical protein [Actinoplanes teichomyceticus]TWG24485.1 hypothetical protein FHX34_1021041 [Actinoplanes teichomyceticus]GIF12664.1 hypothetical protein Ate01nite_26960 [Actinoplanes teichomyceticus]
MSSGGLHIAPESLQASGRRLGAVAHRFASALTAFQAEIAGFGQPWGSDDIGSLIGAAHEEVSSFAYECYQSALGEIAAAGADLSGMALAYSAAEEAIEQRLQTLRAELGR